MQSLNLAQPFATLPMTPPGQTEETLQGFLGGQIGQGGQSGQVQGGELGQLGVAEHGMPPENGMPPPPNGGVGMEQLMVSMLNERDRLMETLRSTQEQLVLSQQRGAQLEKERDLLAQHINASMPQARSHAPLI